MLKLSKLTLKQLVAMMIGFSLIMMILVQVFYYSRFYTLTQERARNYAENLMNQVNEQMLTINKGIENGTSTIAYNRHVQEYLATPDVQRKLIQLYPFVLDVLQYVKSSDENIYDILLTDRDGKLVTSVDSYKNDIYMELLKKYGFTDKQFKTPVHTSVIKDTDDMFYYYAYIMPIFSTTQKVDLFNKIGTCVVICKTNVLEKMVLNVSVSKNSHFFIIDKNNVIVSGNNRTDQGKVFDSHFIDNGNSDVEEQMVDYDGKKSIVQYKTLAKTNWKIVSMIPLAELVSDMESIKSFGLCIGLITILILLLIGAFFSYSITHHISQLVKFMHEIGENNIKQRLKISAPNEVGRIAGDINRMLDKLEDMTRSIFTTQSKLYEVELSKKQSELSALQSQINPHFLYNTLNCISSIGVANDIPEIVNISAAMSRIFRYSIKEEDIIFIKDEIACINDYLSIIKIRYQDKVSVSMKVDEAIYERKTVKMILQPIVENAIYHGLELKKGKGVLIIQGGIIDNRYIQFVISDNGKGMNTQALENLLLQISSPDEELNTKIRTKKGIGLANINNRIKLMFGDEYGIHIESIENEGTRVYLKLPELE